MTLPMFITALRIALIPLIILATRMRFFGGLQGIRQASPEEIARAPGISRRMAEDILAVVRR